MPRIGVALLFGAVIFGLSNVRGSANGDVEDRKLEAFIEAAVAADGVMTTWRPRIAGADSRSAEDFRRQANIEIRESIDKVSGISYAEYRDIRRTIAGDAEMLARVTELMRRRHRRSAGSSLTGERFQLASLRSPTRRNRPLSADS